MNIDVSLSFVLILSKTKRINRRPFYFSKRFSSNEHHPGESFSKLKSRVQINFSNYIVKNTYKISLVLVFPNCAPWLGLRDRKCRNFACYAIDCWKMHFPM